MKDVIHINDNQNKDDKKSREIKSFARRISKSLSSRKKYLLSEILPNYRFCLDKLDANSKVYLEIGFGMGENLINLAERNKDDKNKFFIGAEVYLNGVVAVISKLEELGLQNIFLHPDDVNDLIDEIPDNFLEGVYILFPDPWTKNRQKKKRLMNDDRILKIKNKIKDNGYLIFASDIIDYFENVKISLLKSGFSESDIKPHMEGYKETKYHRKAVIEKRIPSFICVAKNIK
jgi:release factor glutamine methyltransferase